MTFGCLAWDLELEIPGEFAIIDIEGLVQDCSIFSVLAMEILQICASHRYISMNTYSQKVGANENSHGEGLEI